MMYVLISNLVPKQLYVPKRRIGQEALNRTCLEPAQAGLYPLVRRK